VNRRWSRKIVAMSRSFPMCVCSFGDVRRLAVFKLDDSRTAGRLPPGNPYLIASGNSSILPDTRKHILSYKVSGGRDST